MPLVSSRFGLQGAVVTMNNATVVNDGVVWVDGSVGKITDVRKLNDPRPAGFNQAPLINTHGTLFPGLIELHNHLAYNILRLWSVPKQFDHRDQWPNHPDYLRLVRGPMQTLGVAHADQYLESIIRWVEAKCLCGGVTTSQGITLNGAQQTKTLIKGNVRNVELNGPAGLPAAGARIGDLKTGEADEFFKRLKKSTCTLLHLSEGRSGNDHAIDRFERLQLASGSAWAIQDKLAGIHSAALRPAELKILADNGGAIVWSPMSNLLLYGTTADVATAKQLNIRIGIGSDWSPTGSKNLLGELKLARLFSKNNGSLFTDEDIVRMATTTAADILGWEQALGRIAQGFYADLLVVAGTTGDPYKRLIESKETDIVLVTIEGEPRYGRSAIMNQLVTSVEARKVNGKNYAFNFQTGPTPPITVAIPLAQAETKLIDGLKNLKPLAQNAADNGMFISGLQGAALDGLPATAWTLDLSDDVDDGFFTAAGVMESYREVASPLMLDPLTVADDDSYFAALKGQLSHVPAFMRADLKNLY